VTTALLLLVPFVFVTAVGLGMGYLGWRMA
jgi:hypothetical protein